jgi:hypothetical protein
VSTSRSSIGAVHGQHGQPLHQTHEEAKRTRARADDDRRPQRDRIRHGLQQGPLDRQAAGEVLGSRAGGDGPAEVDDPSHAGALRRLAEAPRGLVLARGEALTVAGLHRMDQEVGDLDAVHRRLQAHPTDGVAGDDRYVDRHPFRPAREASDRVALGAQSRGDKRSDIAADAGDEHLHGRAQGAGRT